MLTILQRVLVVMLLVLLQGPTLLLQEIAWANMLYSYSSENGLSQGVVETFNGSRPCSLCLKVKEMKADESDQGSSDSPKDRFAMLKKWQDLLVSEFSALHHRTDNYAAHIGSASDVWYLLRPDDAPQMPPPKNLV